MTTIALVLGAGGVIGGAYHAGTIAALAEATGWDARSADLLVGTSAGSGVSASLRIGLAPADHLARALDQPLSAEATALLPPMPAERVRLPDHPGLRPLDLLRPTAPWLVAPAFLAPGPVRLGLLSGLLPRGRVPTEVVGSRIRAALGSAWPDRPTWVCATRVRDGKRVVFGRDDVTDTDLGTAVEASSAVPSYFAPVTIGSHDYIDGGAFSATNADLVARLGFDLVIVVSPMSAEPSALGLPDILQPARATRALHARMLAREVGAIRAGGSPVLVVQPTATDLEVMGGNALDHRSGPPAARAAHASVHDLLTRPEVADRVRLLARAAAESTPAG